MVYVDYDMVAARDVESRMRTRTNEMHSWLEQLQRASEQTLADWDGDTQRAYYDAKAEWDAGAKQVQDTFDRKIATWGAMVNRTQQGDQDGARRMNSR
jgi:uncharacterized protein YukE